MTEVKIHDKYLMVIPKDVRETLKLRIGETVDVVVEKGKAVLYPKRGSITSVRKLHGIINHETSIEDGIEEGFATIGAELK